MELAACLRLSPTLTLKLALRALSMELAKARPVKLGRLVGKERAALEGKR